MKTATYASVSGRPSGKGHVQAAQHSPFVRGVQEVLRAIDTGLWQALDVSLGWHQRIMDRHALQTMDDRLLKDIGVSRADVEREANKPFWRA